MRITQLMMTNGAIQHMADNQEMMHKLQERIATGKNFASASDDPVNASISLGLRSSLKNIQNYLDTNEQVADWMNASEFSLEKLEEVSNKAQNLILRGLNDSLSGAERKNALAPDMRELLQQALEFANMKHNDQFLFAGVYTSTQPFVLDESGAAPTIVYQPRNLALPTAPPPGINRAIQRTIAPNQTISINVMGESVLKDFLQGLSDAQQALLADDRTALQNSLTAVKLGLVKMDEARTSNGARLRQVQSVGDYLEKSQIEAKSLLSQKEDTNMAEAVMMLKGQETTYQAVLQVSQRAISSTSLFDLLR